MKKTLKTKLRIRFILLSILCLTVMQSIIIGVSIYNNYCDLVKKSDMLISQLHSNSSGGNRYFSVKIPAGKDTVYLDTVQHVSVTTDDIISFAQRVLAKKQHRGFIDGYRYHIYQNESGTKIYFLLRDAGIEMCRIAAKNMILVNVFGLICIGLLLIPISSRVVKPLVDNHCKQKQFITSASHELRTPLTVISTNAQLLELEIGSNDWLDGIQKQILHLTQMTNNLVTLSKAEEYDNPLVRESFSLTDAFRDVVETYEVIAKTNNIKIESVMQDNIVYSGSKAEVQQLIQILLDNACKYCLREGCISINIRRVFQGAKISVTNSTGLLQVEDAQSLVRRFKRGQNITGKTGFGLGLSIAEAIAHRHNGCLTVCNDTDGEFRVEVILR